MGPSEDTSRFPDPAYASLVLQPLFEGTRQNLLASLLRVNRAHCVMLAETGILSEADASRIANGLVRVEATIAEDGLAYAPEHEDVFFAVEALLSRQIGADLAGRLHTGRSRNDLDHTIFRMELLRQLDRLAGDLVGFAESLLAKAIAERDTLIVAYTHGQPAQPTTFGHYLAAALEVLLRDLERIAACRTVVDRSPMGACAITTTGFAIDRERMAALLGFAAPTLNSYGSIAAVDYITSTYGALKLFFLHVGRLIQDLQFWTSFEVGQLHVPNGFVQISSIMPQKRNPVVIEHMRLMASTGAGQAETMLSIMHNTPFTDMNDSEAFMQLEGHRTFFTATRLVPLLSRLIAAVAVEPRNVAQITDRSCITVTELADELVRGEGLSFRQAHEISAEVTHGVLAQGASLRDAGYPHFREAFAQQVKRETAIDAPAFARIVSARHFVEVRERSGGPGAAAMSAAFELYRQAIDRLARTSGDQSKRGTDRHNELDAAFSRLCALRS